jgi:hypothetical protein
MAAETRVVDGFRVPYLFRMKDLEGALKELNAVRDEIRSAPTGEEGDEWLWDTERRIESLRAEIQRRTTSAEVA